MRRLCSSICVWAGLIYCLCVYVQNLWGSHLSESRCLYRNALDIYFVKASVLYSFHGNLYRGCSVIQERYLYGISTIVTHLVNKYTGLLQCYTVSSCYTHKPTIPDYYTAMVLLPLSTTAAYSSQWRWHTLTEPDEILNSGGKIMEL